MIKYLGDKNKNTKMKLKKRLKRISMNIALVIRNKGKMYQDSRGT